MEKRRNLADLARHEQLSIETDQSRIKSAPPAMTSSQGSRVHRFIGRWIWIPNLSFPVRYLVRARVKSRKSRPLLEAIDNGTLGQGSIAGDEYIYNMSGARLNSDGVATWVETCFCDPPLAEERPYWEKYFELLSVKDAHSRRNCRHENGTEPWACCDCDCTNKLEDKLRGEGESFLGHLRDQSSASGSFSSEE